jgi:hypothetical protein
VDAPEPNETPRCPTKAEPVLSGGLFKGLGLLLVAAALGVGAYLIAGPGLDVELPDLPESTTGEATTIEEGDLRDPPIPPAAQDARSLNRCISAAANDPDRIFACLEKF